jgi:hypothetical protein
LPAILASAEAVEWGVCNATTIARALECWYPSAAPTNDVACKLDRWWRTYADGNSAWTVAWRALESLLG